MARRAREQYAPLQATVAYEVRAPMLFLAAEFPGLMRPYADVASQRAGRVAETR